MDIFIKQNVNKHEYDMHKYISQLNIINTPKIISYDNKNKTMTMEKINEDNISNIYGELSENIPTYIFDEIRNIINILYQNNISYPDITGYNFIEYDNKIWIIDFEHSYFTNSSKFTDDFITEFINGLNNWNPEFK